MVAVELASVITALFRTADGADSLLFFRRKNSRFGNDRPGEVMVVSKHRDHFRLGCPAYSTGINLFPGCGVGCLFSDGSSIIGMLAGFWNSFRLCITTHQTGKFLLSFCFTGSCGYYLSISVGMLLIAALFRIIGNITGSISGHTFMPMVSES